MEQGLSSAFIELPSSSRGASICCQVRTVENPGVGRNSSGRRRSGLAALHHADTVGDAQRDMGELLDQQDADACGELGDHRHQPRHDNRRKAERQLVSEDVARPRDDRLAEDDHLLLAAGERAGALREFWPELREGLERGLDAFLPCGRGR